MIISAERTSALEYEENGKHYHLKHHIDLRPTLELIEQRRQDNASGFSKDRQWEYIGTIPMEVMMRDPELKENPNKAYDWLQRHKEFKLKPNMRQTHAGIIVK